MQQEVSRAARPRENTLTSRHEHQPGGSFFCGARAAAPSFCIIFGNRKKNGKHYDAARPACNRDIYIKIKFNSISYYSRSRKKPEKLIFFENWI